MSSHLSSRVLLDLKQEEKNRCSYKVISVVFGTKSETEVL